MGMTKSLATDPPSTNASELRQTIKKHDDICLYQLVHLRACRSCCSKIRLECSAPKTLHKWSNVYRRESGLIWVVGHGNCPCFSTWSGHFEWTLRLQRKVSRFTSQKPLIWTYSRLSHFQLWSKQFSTTKLIIPNLLIFGLVPPQMCANSIWGHWSLVTNYLLKLMFADKVVRALMGMIRSACPSKHACPRQKTDWHGGMQLKNQKVQQSSLITTEIIMLVT
jgi:hypothetical protein